MKIFTLKLLVITILLISTKQFAQCGNGTITLSTQQEVDDFTTAYAGCTSFAGNLQISGSDITNLAPLAQLTSVTGNLRLWGNSSLTNLQGLHNIISVGGDLDLSGYSFPLSNLNGLQSLQTVGGMVSIQDFQNLVSIQGLSNLTSVNGNFLIQNNNNTDFTSIILPNLSFVGIFNIRNNSNLTTIAFSGLQNVGSTFHLVSNNNLVTANFPVLQTVGSGLLNATQINNGKFEVYQCSNLVNPNFSALQTVKGHLDFIQNNNLQSLGFQNLSSVLRSIRINSNPALNSIDGLSGLTGNISSLSINESNIPNVNALSNITSIGGSGTGDLILSNNPLLSNISGLGNLSSVTRNLEITNNDALLNLNGLNALTTIPNGYLSIMDNALLENIDGLQNLASVGNLGDVQGVLIVNNAALQNLNGLSSLATLKGGLTIRNNPSLIDVSGITITSFLTGAYNNFILENNSSLQNLSGMSIQQLKGQVQILGNAALQAIDFTVLNPSQPVSVLLDNNVLLQNISGLGAVNQINGSSGGFRIINNDSLENLDGLNITDINGNYLFIKDNATLENIDGLSSLLTIGNNASLEITNNALLSNVDGLSQLTKAGKILVQNNNSLQNINGLSSVTQLTMTSDTKLLSIFNNPNLESIQGVRNIVQTSIANLVISTNPKTAVCDLKNICDYLATAKPRSINGNASGCNSVAQIQSSCPTIWNGSAWSDGLPNATRSAVIMGNLNLDSNLSVKNFTVNNGVFKIPANFSLTVTGSVINNQNEEKLIVENDGNLIQTNDAELRNNQGKITVRSTSNPFKRLDYTLWSSPVKNQNLFGFSPETVNGITNYPGEIGRIYAYEGSNGFVNPAPFNEDSVFENAKGYLFRAPNTWSQTVPLAYNGTFIGIPNNGMVTVSTHPNSFTSVGNPYPSTLDATALLATNPSLGTLYFWTNTYAAQNGSYNQNNYATYTLAGGTAVNAQGVEPTSAIATGQGFIAYNESNQLTFNNAMRIGESANFFRNPTEKHRLWISLKGENDNHYNQILVSYMTGATSGVDNQIDGRLFGYSGSALYSVIDNEKFSIQGRALPFNNADIVPLGFKAQEEGTFTISLSNFDGLFTEGEVLIFLKDNLTNSIHNLTTDYIFTSVAGEFNQRFEIFYQSALSVEDRFENNLLIHRNNGDLVVKTFQEMQEIKVYDMQGRLIFKADKVNSSHYRIPAKAIQSKLLIFRVESQGRFLTQKVIH